jgi:hypothetical protein
MIKCWSRVIVYMHVVARETSPLSAGILNLIADRIAASSDGWMFLSIVDGVQSSPTEWMATFGSPVSCVRGNP